MGRAAGFEETMALLNGMEDVDTPAPTAPKESANSPLTMNENDLLTGLRSDQDTVPVETSKPLTIKGGSIPIEDDLEAKMPEESNDFVGFNGTLVFCLFALGIFWIYLLYQAVMCTSREVGQQVDGMCSALTFPFVYTPVLSTRVRELELNTF